MRNKLTWTILKKCSLLFSSRLFWKQSHASKVSCFFLSTFKWTLFFVYLFKLFKKFKRLEGIRWAPNANFPSSTRTWPTIRALTCRSLSRTTQATPNTAPPRPILTSNFFFASCYYKNRLNNWSTCLNRDGKWGFCLDYQQCHFPFMYENALYFDCISGAQASRMCATTASFDQDRKWKHCPSECELLWFSPS